jgi:chromatin segregation and condensation protein Rec8/ScpA/Scc1 (kleisin family)
LALEQIEASTEDTARIEKEIYKETNQKKGKRPVTRKEVVQRKDTSKGLWVSLKRLFGNNPMVYDTVTKVGQDFFTYEDTSYDTSVIKSYNPDTVLFKVKQILAQAENMEIQMQFPYELPQFVAHKCEHWAHSP